MCGEVNPDKWSEGPKDFNMNQGKWYSRDRYRNKEERCEDQSNRLVIKVFLIKGWVNTMFQDDSQAIQTNYNTKIEDQTYRGNYDLP